MGGIVCLACSPPPADRLATVPRLACVGGLWRVPGVDLAGESNSQSGATGGHLAKPAGGSVELSGSRDVSDDRFDALIKSYRWELDWSVNEARAELAMLAFTGEGERQGWHRPVMTDAKFRLLCKGRA